MLRLFICLHLLACTIAAAPERVIDVTVAQDGSGDFKTIQQAIDHAPDEVAPDARLIIHIKAGTYHERVKIPHERPRVTLLGEAAASTLITFGMSAKEAGGTFFSPTVEVNGAAFHAENVTFENSFGTGSQAVAIAVHSDKAVFRKCRFVGWQDTLYAAWGRQHYFDCFVEGHVDFIFGNATAVLDHCEIHSRAGGYIAAESGTSPAQTTGFVFYKCKLTGEGGKKGVFLARPWRPYSRVVYIDCEMGAQIRPEGWNNWNHTAANEKTAWFGEYGSKGPGATPAARLKWVHELTPGDVKQFLPNVFLRGIDDWQAAAAR